MARQRKILGRKPAIQPDDEQSILLRSAESLGRVIGALQRQLDEAARRLNRSSEGTRRKTSAPAPATSANGVRANRPKVTRVKGEKTRKRAAATQTGAKRSTKKKTPK